MNSPLNPSKYVPNQDCIRVATATPEVSIGDVPSNVKGIKKLYADAVQAECSLVVFPELSITGYTIQDLVAHQSLLHAAEQGLIDIAKATTNKNTVAVVGLPIKMGNATYNCAAVVSEGEIRGIIPKQNLPTYNEFYEKRWYQAWQNKQNTAVSINGSMVPFGTEQLFTIGNAILGIEIC